MSGKFTSHATNFTSVMQTGVDPRTGQFFIHFPLLTAQAHQLLGPNVDLTLSFSSLSLADDFGLGKGVTLGGVSWFDQKNHQLRLSSGESWSVSGGGEISNRRLKDCLFKHNGIDSKTVYWKSGVTEILGKVGVDHYLTKQIISPSGKQVHLEWLWSGGAALLRSIKDENDVIICQWDYKGVALINQLIPGTSVTLTVWPYATERYQVGLRHQNGNLVSLVRQSHASDSDKSVWSMKFDALGGRSVPAQLRHPTGMVDIIAYNNTALRFPVSSAQVALAAVSRHTRKYGRGQPDTVRDYTYTKDRNFLGYGVSEASFGKWQESKDYLAQMLTRTYEYGSTETIHQDGQKRTVTRTYNNYHFLISEQDRQGQCLVHKETQYQAKYNVDISKQPCDYSLPKTETITYKRGAQQSRVQVMHSSFDEYGNPRSITHPDGTVETYEWYPAQGEGQACPAEPIGFVRFLKEKRTTFPQVNGYSLPDSVVSYTYETLGESACVVQKTSAEYTEQDGKQTCLGYKENLYDSDAGPAFGRVRQIDSTQYDLAHGQTGYTTTQRFVTQADESHTKLTQTIESETHDGLIRRHTRVLSALSGRSQMDIDSLGVVTNYEYDGLGRILSQTHAAQTEYSTTQHWEYSLEDGYPVTIQQDALGNQQRTLFDGAGRAVQTDVYDADLSFAWYMVSAVHLDSLGRTIKMVNQDWTSQDRDLAVASPSIHTQREYVYDDWGNLAQSTANDVTEVIEYDPIACIKTVYRHPSNYVSLVESRMVTRFDPVSQRPIETSLIGQDGQAIGYSQSVWDGLGRLRKFTDIDGHLTEWDYDVYGRVIGQTLPDGSVVEQRYAPDQSGSVATQIGIRERADEDLTVIGTRRYDGQGRLSENVCGARQSTYCYDSAASEAPQQVILPSGDKIECEYIAELGQALSQVTGKNEENDEIVVKQFAYDLHSHQPISQLEGQCSSRFDYAVSGALKMETQEYEGSEHTASYTYTLGGLVQNYTAVNDTRTDYERDTLGRVVRIEDQGVTVALTYDKWGRLSARKVSSWDGNELTTWFVYDEHGREISRRIEDGEKHGLHIKQSWYNNGLLSSRDTRQNDDSIRYEEYKYDCRARLTEYTVSGEGAPQQHGNTITSQSYTYDVLNNIQTVVTTHTDNTFDTASYHYDNSDDFNQLTSIEYTHDTYPSVVSLAYDVQGRMIKDEAGRLLAYDILGRLVQVQSESEQTGSTYTYDANDRLIEQWVNNEEKRLLFYRGEELIHEIQGDSHRSYSKAGHTGLAVREGESIALLGVDQSNSVVYTKTATETTHRNWMPYGSEYETK